MNLKDTELPMLYENPPITEDRVEFKKIEKDEKFDEEDFQKNFRFTKNELDKNNYYNKGRRVDLLGEYQGTLINIEINNNDTKEMMERNLEYTFRQYLSGIKTGEDFKPKRCIQINIDTFAFRNEEGKSLSDKIILIHIFIPNIIRKWYNQSIESLTELERYILVMMIKNVEDACKLVKGDKIMEEFVEDAIICSQDEQLLESYNKEEALKNMFLKEV